MANPARTWLDSPRTQNFITVVFVLLLSKQMVKFELGYALGHAERAPSNESPWNYVRGFFRDGRRSYADFPEVKERVILLKVCGALL